MPFIESPRFPEEVSAWMHGGEEFLTIVATNAAGFEKRNQVWATPVRRYSIGGAMRAVKNAQATIAFFRAMGGRANGFRVKDFLDYQATLANGVLGAAGVGSAMPGAYQLYKNYSVGALQTQQKITKPVAGTVQVYRNAVLQTAGAGAGQYAVDTTTGLVTLVADVSQALASVTVGANTVLNFANSTGIAAAFVNGQKVYLSGISGTAAATLNGMAHTVVGGAGNSLSIVTSTLGLTATGGTAAKYAQATDALTWAGEFDVPCRFDADWLQIGMDPGGLLNWDSVTLLELRA